jgi:DNA-directed RNA polymerase subunit M/transcription elongation factor TFIIS
MGAQIAQAEESPADILGLFRVRSATYYYLMTTPKSGTSVSCPCGASLEIDPNETTQELACPECGMTLEVAINIDSRTKQVRLGILVKDNAVAHRRTKGKGVEVHTAKCVCGAQITIEPEGMDSFYTCASCGADYTASVKKPKSGGSSTLVLRQVTASPMSKITRRSVAKPPPPPPPKAPPPRVFAKAPAPPAVPSAAGLAAKERFLQMAKTDVGAQEVGDDRVQCFCRAQIKLKGDFHREIVKCDECGMGFRMFQATNPKTGASMVVMIPRG